MYSCYETAPLGEEPEDEARPSDRRKAIILGGGPNRIGQGIEFDYCCVHAVFGLKEAGIETIMINCNPETVSTDPDTSDRLYFEPLTAEDVLGDLPGRGEPRRAPGRDRPARRADALEAGAPSGAGGRADPGHLARRHRPGRGPRALPGPSPPAGPEAAGQRHRQRCRGGGREGRPARFPAGDPPLLRAGRAGDADRVCGGRGPGLRPGGGTGIRDGAGAARPVPLRRDRDRCGRALRRRDRACRRRDGACRGGGRSFGRQRLLAAALHPLRRGGGGDRAAGRGAGAERSRFAAS